MDERKLGSKVSSKVLVSFDYKARLAAAKAKLKVGDTFTYEGHTGRVIGIYSHHFVVEFTVYNDLWGHKKDRYRESFQWHVLIDKEAGK